MRLLVDQEIKEKIKNNKLIEGIDIEKENVNKIDSKIQPCSVDLTIHEIFLPLSVKDKTLKRTFEHKIAVGESIRVSTEEKIKFDKKHAGIVYAPAQLSRKGLVVFDIAHIDPGFEGILRFTIINMGRDSFTFKRGDKIATVLIFELNKEPAYGLKEKSGEQPYNHGEEDIKYLSPDFLNIDKRIKEESKKVAKKALGSSGWRWAFIQVFLPILLALVITYVTTILMFNKEIKELKSNAQQYKFEEKIESKLDSLNRVIEIFTIEHGKRSYNNESSDSSATN